jgi:hypothetical protein
VEIHTEEMSLDAQTRKLWEDLATIRSDYLRDYDKTNVTIHATINKTRSATEAKKREFQARLNVAEARGDQQRGQLVAPGEIDVLYYSPERPGRGRATRHSDKREL